jgi:two-component system, chemotaxis family, protein-glutamate methylesterase/glutaminase
MKQVKVLLVDDSPTMREHLRDIIYTDPRLLLIGEAANGEEAIRLTEKLRPDVISMDVYMPVMDGLTSVKEIMRVCPTPIVVVSGSRENSELNSAFNAIRSGALAVIGKPPAITHSSYKTACLEFCNTLYSMSEVAVIHRWHTSGSGRKPLSMVSPIEPSTQASVKIIGIASSTGGPSALAEILSQLPASFPVPIVIVQHISTNFERGLVDWLLRVSHLDVQIAQDGQRLQAGQVLIAPSGSHLRVRSNKTIALDAQRGAYINMPAADVMLESLADVYKSDVAGVILTGMGNDGARGIRAIYDVGGRTIAQDAESSVVFGMPKEAIHLGGVQRVLPLNTIAKVLMSLLTPIPLLT